MPTSIQKTTRNLFILAIVLLFYSTQFNNISAEGNRNLIDKIIDDNNALAQESDEESGEEDLYNNYSAIQEVEKFNSNINIEESNTNYTPSSPNEASIIVTNTDIASNYSLESGCNLSNENSEHQMTTNDKTFGPNNISTIDFNASNATNTNSSIAININSPVSTSSNTSSSADAGGGTTIATGGGVWVGAPPPGPGGGGIDPLAVPIEDYYGLIFMLFAATIIGLVKMKRKVVVGS
jgi:hypothetical protein